MAGWIEALLSVDAAVLSLDDQLDHLVLLQELAARVSARTQRCLAAVAGWPACCAGPSAPPPGGWSRPSKWCAGCLQR